jgi:PBP1b-binding outer membrane lipoprotein LpoB
MRRLIIITAVLVSALLFSGCGIGLIYTHTVEPLNPNMKHRTEMTPTSGQGDIKQIALYDVSVTWNDDSIGSIAREKGLKELYYADREILSVMFGIWKQETIHVYGR